MLMWLFFFFHTNYFFQLFIIISRILLYFFGLFYRQKNVYDKFFQTIFLFLSFFFRKTSITTSTILFLFIPFFFLYFVDNVNLFFRFYKFVYCSHTNCYTLRKWKKCMFCFSSIILLIFTNNPRTHISRANIPRAQIQ